MSDELLERALIALGALDQPGNVIRYSPQQQRVPAGSDTGGQFGPGGPAKKQPAPQRTFSYNPRTNKGAGYGTKGGDPQVKALQEMMNRLGITDAKGHKLAVDGKFGPLTTQAATSLQTKLGLDPTGHITQSLLDKLVDAKTLDEAKAVLKRKPRAATRDTDMSVSAWNAAHPKHPKGANGKWADTPGGAAGEIVPGFRLPDNISQQDYDRLVRVGSYEHDATSEEEAWADSLNWPTWVKARAEGEGWLLTKGEWYRNSLPGDLKNMPIDELRERMTGHLRETWAGKPIAVRVFPDNLEAILRDGRFKTQFESGSAGKESSYQPKRRADVEAMLFGIPHDSDPSKRPVYGYVAMDPETPWLDKTLNKHGSIAVVLKDKVRDRTTAMVGDSINEDGSVWPSPVNDPSWVSANPQIVQNSIRRFPTSLDDGRGRDTLHPEFRANEYVEAQIHGGVTVDDIAEVVFLEKPSAAMESQLKSAGIPWRISMPPVGTVADRRASLREVVAAQVREILLGDIDDDPIGELDDDTLILLQAMAELDADAGIEARAFDPKLHARWPKGHPKAGKFRTMVDLLKMAIAEHDGQGHPFQNFNREQLRKAAKTRGITLKKGEDRDSIAMKLLADLGGPSVKSEPDTKPSTAKPAVKKAAPKKVAPTKAAAKPASVETGDFSGLKRVGGQAGTTPGGVFEAPDGSRWYVKAQKSAAHANNEALASALYREAGIDAPAVLRGKGAPGLPGEHHTATRLVDGAQTNLAFKLGDDAYINKIREGFAADAWLANWDVVGEGSESPWANIVEGGDGRPHRTDVGGALLFRGKGGEKGDRFGSKVVEFDTMRDATKARRHVQVFAEMTDEQLSESVNRIKAITSKRIHDLVAEHGFDIRLAELLVARRQDLLSRMKAAAKISPKGWENAATGQAALDAAPIAIRGVSETRGLLEKAGLDPDIAKKATNGFRDYQGSSYGPMNRAMLSAAGGDLRAGSHYGLDDNGVSMIEGMREAMKVSKLTKDVIVYRGERAPARNFPPGVWSMTGGMEGMEWTFHPFGSSSTDDVVAKEFARGPTLATADVAQPTVMRILARKGTRAVHLRGGLPSEQELLLGDGLKYRVVKDHGVVDDPGYSKGIRRLDVEVVPA